MDNFPIKGFEINCTSCYKYNLVVLNIFIFFFLGFQFFNIDFKEISLAFSGVRIYI